MRKQLLRWVLMGVMLMARGLPDDSNVVKEGSVYSLDDMAELAVRLGSPVRYVRYGDVVWMDSFEHGKNAWDEALYGADATWGLDNSHSLTGGMSLRLDSGILNEAGVKVVTYHAPLVSDVIGVHWAFSIGAMTNRIRFYIIPYAVTVSRNFRLEYVVATEKFQVLDDTVGDVEVTPALPLEHGALLFHHVKLIINQSTGEYQRLIYNTVSYPLTGNYGDVGAGVADPRLDVAFQVRNDTVGHTEVWLDDVILTINER